MNYGKKIEKVEKVTLSTANKPLNLLKSGQVCRVDVIKADGTLRTFSSCRTGIKKRLKGGGRRSVYDTGAITVWEFGVGYRSFAIDRIAGVKHGGIWYDFTRINELNVATPPGPQAYGGTRTWPAENSPLYG